MQTGIVIWGRSERNEEVAFIHDWNTDKWVAEVVRSEKRRQELHDRSRPGRCGQRPYREALWPKDRRALEALMAEAMVLPHHTSEYAYALY